MSTTQATTEPSTDTVRLSRRELNLICRRLLVAHDAPSGLIPAAAHAMLDGITLGLPILDPDAPDLGVPSNLLHHRSPAWRLDGATVTVTGHGQWAPVIVPALSDIICMAVFGRGAARLELAGVVNGEAAEATRGRLARAGIVMTRDEVGTSWWLSRGDDADFRAAQRRLISEGVPFSRNAWLTMYRASLRGLAPESEESFRHAGYVDADGEPISGMDDDHDIELALNGLVGTTGA